MPKIEKYIRWIGIPILAFFMTFLSEHEGSENYTWLENYGLSILFTGIYWNGCFLIFMFYRKMFPDIRQTMKKLTLTIGSIIAFILLFTPMLRLLMGLITWEQLKNTQVTYEFIPVTILASIMVGSMYEGAFFFDKWRISVQQNEQLKNQQIRTQFEVLQNQMSPHFLFNCLNALTTLIAENKERAIEFTEKLSEVYRYILQHRDRELIALEEELDFAKSYVFLLQMRFPDNLHVKFDIPNSALSYSIAPLTLQMLIENAMKHNVISQSKPLHVEIYLDKQNCIIVKNNFQPKTTLENSTKTGLANIKKRYEFLGKNNVEIINTKENFMVAVPLMKVHASTTNSSSSWG